MSFLNLFGSESKTDQTAYNQQVGASQGSIAFGASSSGNSVRISSSNPEVAEAAISGQVEATKAALGAGVAQSALAYQFAGGVAQGAFGAANLSVASATDLAGKFMTALQRSYQGSTDFASSALVASTNAQQAALAQSLNAVSALSGQVANIAAAQTPGGLAMEATQTTSDSTFKIVLVAAAALVLLSLLKKG